MAKKKSKNKSKQQLHISPERFLREKARSLPIGKCFITPHWKEEGIGQVIVTRLRPSGNVAVGVFLVDLFCLGVKDAFYYVNMSPEAFSAFLDRFEPSPGLEEISYNEAHNIIYGAIAFAEEAGIEPHRDFDTASYILEEDTDEIPLIEYEYGKDGKYFLVVNPDRWEMRYIDSLRSRLGDRLEVLMLDSDEDEDDDPEIDLDKAMSNWDSMMEESRRHPSEPYSYHYPDYPSTLSLKHQFIADELLSPDNVSGLSRGTVDKILSLPVDEAVEDISAVVMYEIGRTHKAITEDTIKEPFNSALIQSVMLLTQLRSPKALPALLEIMKQDDPFLEYHFSDWMSEIMHQAVYSCGKENIAAIEEYIYTPGLNSYFREQATDALVMIAINHHDRRDEIIELFRRLLISMVDRLPETNGCDGTFAGFLMCNLMDINAKELIPEITAVYATDCVDKSIPGSLQSVVEDLENENHTVHQSKYRFPDIFVEISRLRDAYERSQRPS